MFSIFLKDIYSKCFTTLFNFLPFQVFYKKLDLSNYKTENYKVVDFRKSKDFNCKENDPKNNQCADDIAVLKLDKDLPGIQVANFTCKR